MHELRQKLEGHALTSKWHETRS